MKNIFLVILGLMVFIASNSFAQGFTLTSPDISGQLSQQQVYSGFGCKGQNVSPELNWHGAPENTKSFAVTVYDPDAPTGSGWWHWVIFNIPARVSSLKSGAGNLKANIAPEGSIQSITDFGNAGYGGACPPKGDRAHRYIFTVYALDTAKLDLGSQSSPALTGFVINKHTLAKASIIAYYSR